MNVTQNVQLQSTGTGTGTNGVDVWINTCVEVGDQGPTHATPSDFGFADGQDSGSWQNSNNQSLYGTKVVVANGNFQSSINILRLCDAQVKVNKIGSFQINSGTAAGQNLCVGVEDLFENSGTWTVTGIKWYSEKQNSTNVPGAGAEQSKPTVLECFQTCCVAAANCTIKVGAITPPVCNTATNRYTLSGTVSLTSATAQSLTVTDGTSTQTVSVSTGQTSAAFSLTGANLISDGSSHTVTVGSVSCGTSFTTYTAPTSCIVAPCTLAAVVGIPVCNTLINNYTATGTVSLSNTPAGSLTITDNGNLVAVVSVTTGQTSAGFSVTGLSDVSSHTIIVTASNQTCGTASTTYSAPASCTVCSLSLTTSMLANGQIGTAYSQTLTTSGATAPATFIISAGNLPTGLSLNPTTGVISGIPTAPAGTASFTVTVTDSKNCSAVAPLTITTAAEPVCSLTITANPGLCQTTTNQYTVTGTVSATNTTGSQSLTIAVNGSSTVVTLTGNGPVNYTERAKFGWHDEDSDGDLLGVGLRNGFGHLHCPGFMLGGGTIRYP